MLVRTLPSAALSPPNSAAAMSCCTIGQLNPRHLGCSTFRRLGLLGCHGRGPLILRRCGGPAILCGNPPVLTALQGHGLPILDAHWLRIHDGCNSPTLHGHRRSIPQSCGFAIISVDGLPVLDGWGPHITESCEPVVLESRSLHTRPNGWRLSANSRCAFFRAALTFLVLLQLLQQPIRCTGCVAACSAPTGRGPGPVPGARPAPRRAAAPPQRARAGPARAAATAAAAPDAATSPPAATAASAVPATAPAARAESTAAAAPPAATSSAVAAAGEGPALRLWAAWPAPIRLAGAPGGPAPLYAGAGRGIDAASGTSDTGPEGGGRRRGPRGEPLFHGRADEGPLPRWWSRVLCQNVGQTADAVFACRCDQALEKLRHQLLSEDRAGRVKAAPSTVQSFLNPLAREGLQVRHVADRMRSRCYLLH
mmetsp:Transcript_12546/g.34604  ORF Transcript_12546/g.34604 Transcript_12546/m.34604 type:complete len:424 (-) Transcript_12546:993-2264(-)